MKKRNKNTIQTDSDINYYPQRRWPSLNPLFVSLRVVDPLDKGGDTRFHFLTLSKLLREYSRNYDYKTGRSNIHNRYHKQ